MLRRLRQVAGLPCTAESRALLRLRLADFALANVNDPRFREAFDILEAPPGSRTAAPRRGASSELDPRASGEAPAPVEAEADAAGAPSPEDLEVIRWASAMTKPTETTLLRLWRSLTPQLREANRKRFAERGASLGPRRRATGALVGARKLSTVLRKRLADAAAVRDFRESTTCGGDYLGAFLTDRHPTAGSQVRQRLRRYYMRAEGLLASTRGDPVGCGGALAPARAGMPAGSGSSIPTKTSFAPIHHANQRRRRTGCQGRPVRAPAVRELLFEWFSSLRRSVLCRIPPSLVISRAKLLVEAYVEQCLRNEVQPQPPVVSRVWLYRWCAEYGISLRHPNRRYAVSRAVLEERVVIDWSNVVRVRALCQAVHGYDPVCENFDQSPFHLNEVGSKGAKTLAYKGSERVPLKENHAATRARWTVQTMVISEPPRVRRIPPLELMFKADGERLEARLQGFLPTWAPWLTVVTSPRGSYREEHVLRYLERHLEPMHPDREWRILLCDCFAPQMSDAVRRLSWARGYVLLIHGGGTTSVMQPNDTDLHQQLRREYCEYEMAELIRQQREDPRGTPSARAEHCIAWMAAVWRNPTVHEKAATGFKATGLTAALDGSEDQLITREAGFFSLLPAWRSDGRS